MAVKVGSARAGEDGYTNQTAGDASGAEVSTQNWYLHSKGWVVLRPDPEYAEKIAYACQAACDNNNIGYDQTNRNTLYNETKKVGFNPAKVTKKVECDCSSLVRVCCAYAGITVGDFNTASEVSTLVGTGKFTKLTASQYTTKSDYLKRGDVLVTKTKGHTVVALSDGSKAGSGGTSSSTGSGAYYPAFSSASIVDGLKSIGVDSSKANRAEIAEANGISNYTGTSDQNEKLLALARQGKLKRVGSSSSGVASSAADYSVGSVYTLQVDRLAVRTGAGTNYSRKSYSQLTANARENAYSDGYLREGTRVTCKAVKSVGSDIWIRIPSGWVAAYYGGKVYIA